MYDMFSFFPPQFLEWEFLSGCAIPAEYCLFLPLLELIQWLKTLYILVVRFLTHLSLVSFLWDIGKQHSPRCDAVRGVPSGAILFAKRNFIEKWDKK